MGCCTLKLSYALLLAANFLLVCVNCWLSTYLIITPLIFIVVIPVYTLIEVPLYFGCNAYSFCFTIAIHVFWALMDVALAIIYAYSCSNLVQDDSWTYNYSYNGYENYDGWKIIEYDYGYYEDDFTLEFTAAASVIFAISFMLEVAILIVFAKLPRDHTCCPVTCCRCCCQPFIEADGGVNQSRTGVEAAISSDVTGQLPGHSLHPPSYADTVVQSASAPAKSFHS